MAHQKAAGRPRVRRRRPHASAWAEYHPTQRVCEGAGLRRELHDELLRGVPRQNLSDDGQASGCPSSLLARPSEGQRYAHGQPQASAIRPTAPITRALRRQRVAGGPTALCVASRCWRKNEGTLAGRRHHHPPPALLQKRMMLVIPPTHSQSCTTMGDSNKAETDCSGTLSRQTALI